ncbi:M48 family metalloprotease [Novosphingobium sp.]|uniref:M48 family metalloprotease n=1 Tax=Novosphingobium sp. TaxID=1874826 RepID=UPI003D11E492
MAALFTTLVIAGCVGLAGVARAADSSPTDRWDELRNEDLRVAMVAYRMSIGNAGLCRGRTAPQFGFVIHALGQYSAGEREKVAHRFGLGALVGVMAVVPGSPAAHAGLVADDQLIAVNDRDLRPLVVAPGEPTNAAVVAAQRILAAEFAKGPVTLRVASATGDRTVRFSAEAGCPAIVEVVPGAAINAWADGHSVVISAGLLRRCDRDEDLALVIAHELSHNLLRHAERLARGDAATNGLLRSPGAGSAQIRETEEEADRLAAHLAIGARYDLRGAVHFLGGLIAGAGLDRPDDTHPATARRLALLSGAIADAQSGRAGPALP